MRAILTRVGIDQTADSGNWNAPCNPRTGDFVYVPIKQTKPANVSGMEKLYADTVIPALASFSERNGCDASLPEHLTGGRMHLDPDFENLTYGDTDKRGKKLLIFEEGDLVVFFAAFNPVAPAKDSLVYALIGILTVKEIVRAGDVPQPERDENAHTRNSPRKPTDIVVRGKTEKSGRLSKIIPIGEFRNKSYRVTNTLLKEWGGLAVKDGYLQRSANPPLFSDAERFYDWFQNQNPQLLRTNNP
ncbi:Nmad3 family putative nucleotide modification protein [Candidatus Mycalebacterium sp.]